MKNIKKLVFIIILMTCALLINLLAYAKTTDAAIPYASGTKSTSKTVTKTLASSEGNLTISYTISGLYIYDLNTGEITSAYGGSLKNVELISAPHDGDWELSIRDIVIGTPTISTGGASARYPVRFHVYARFLPGGVGLWKTIDFGIVNDYAMAYAE